ncbi:MAG: ketohexokinase [Gammaproteobacteria bacterium RBG_16_57_12]|nr:MAG: ketohexokinase [Gammaproteobacteria bacterium RBG_16_57_12]
MAHILGMGIATLDIINTVDGYPVEDSEVRALSQCLCRGGNATNTLVVLSQLGHACAWAGVLANEPDSRLIREDLARYAIDISPCRIEPHGKVPTSYITLNQQNGSRTIVHYRDLPEYRFEDFARIDLGPYQWLHFEGRAVEETAGMIALAKERRPDLPISLEVEKDRPGLDKLFGGVDVLLFSRAYALRQGYADARSFLQHIRNGIPATIVCSWGGQGAYAMNEKDEFLHSPAHQPLQLIDTIGAGDTFNAGFISARLAGKPVREALQFACYIAGVKCGQRGFAGLTVAAAQTPVR